MRRSVLAAFLCTVATMGACRKDDAPTPSPGPGVAMPDPFKVNDVPIDAAPDATAAPVPPALVPTTTPCTQLARAECLRSEHCTLELVGSNVYRCRADNGKCEAGVRQNNPAECAAVAGCTYVPNSCYCACEGHARTETVDEPPSGCACACGGGKPPSCVESKAADSRPAPATRKPGGVPAPRPTTTASARLSWTYDERAAFTDAKARGKGVMIDFAAEWCGPCKKLDHTLSAPPVAPEITASFVALRFDVTNGTSADDAAQAKYNAQTLPTVVFVDVNGIELGRITDDASGDAALAAVRSAARKLKQ